MHIQLIFPELKPISINAVYATDFKTKRRFRSKKYGEFESSINSILKLAYKNDLIKINKTFDPTLHYLKMDYRFYYPVLKKDNSQISKHSVDTTNCLKPLEDIICKYLGIDDSYVIGGSFEKIHSDKIRIVVELKLCDLSLYSI